MPRVFILPTRKGTRVSGVEDSLSLLVEITLVGRAATFGDTEEVIFVSVSGFDVDLRGQVATCVHLSRTC